MYRISKIARGFLLSLPVFVVKPAIGQQATDTPRIQLEAGGFVSTGKTLPFWARTNQYGEVPLESGIFTVRAQIAKDYKPLTDKKSRFSYGYGIRGVANVGSTNQLLLPEAYVKVRYGAFEIYGGRRREMIGLADSTLSGGSYIWSGNALPMPKIQISIPHYTPILKNGLVAVKGNFSHGWFGSDEFTKSYFLHQKSIYVRLGKPQWNFKFHAGLNHHAHWGGKPSEPYKERGTDRLITSYGNNLTAYKHIVLGTPVHPDEDPDLFGDGSLNEAGNRAGNHLGSVDVALEYDHTDLNVLLYRQSIYDDGSLFYLNNIKDGLNGISFTRKGADQGVIKLVVEYLYTANQGGSLGSGSASTVIPELRGRDNYFSNSIYKAGWSYKGNIIGTPFIMPWTHVTGITPAVSNNSYPNFIANNRVKAWMFALQSRIGYFDLTTRLAFSENLGNYRFPFSASQTSVQQAVAFPVGQFKAQAALYYDQGRLLGNNLGMSVMVKREF